MVERPPNAPPPEYEPHRETDMSLVELYSGIVVVEDSRGRGEAVEWVAVQLFDGELPPGTVVVGLMDPETALGTGQKIIDTAKAIIKKKAKH